MEDLIPATKAQPETNSLSQALVIVSEAKEYLSKEGAPTTGQSYRFELIRSVKRNQFDERLALCSMLITTRKMTTVLQLNCGGDDILETLSKKYPQTEFIGIDEDPPPSYIPNLIYYKTSLHKLEMISDKSVDCVLSFNALGYSARIEHTFSEIYRVVRERGIFLAFDLFLTKPLDEFDRNVLLATEGIEDLWHCEKILSYQETCQKLTQSGFVIQGEEDFTSRVQTQLRDLSMDAYRYHRSRLGPLWRRMVPRSGLEKAFGGMLIYELSKLGVVQIRLLVAGRPDTLA